MSAQLDELEILPVEVTGLVAKYGPRTVLDGVHFTARPHEITVILGGSGCGKSTLLRHIMGLYHPAGGSVKLFGRELTQLSEREARSVRTRMGVLFQNGALFTSMTIGENIALVIRELTDVPEPLVEQMVRMKLSMVGLEAAIGKYPAELSGGMCKRAALARAMACDPDILLCDEPSAGLDPIVATELDDLLLEIKNLFGTTIIVVTHELESIKKIADRVVMLDQGRVLAHGPLNEVLQSQHPMVQHFFMRRAMEDAQRDTSLLQQLGAAPQP